jgi:hypothetical protein
VYWDIAVPSRALNLLSARRTRVYLAWAALLIVVGHRAGQGWVNFRQSTRPAGNDGYTSIDFGGQWMMGRLLVLGHGRELYSRARHLEVARQAFPIDQEPPNKPLHDAEQLIEWYPGDPDDPVSGPLYPPVHAFLMAPLALIPDPYLAYRIAQALMLGLTLFAGLGVRYGTAGKWWWPVAAAFLVAFPGCRGGISLAQNSSLTLAILIWGWAVMVRGRPGWGGFLWGLLAFKPVWALSFLLALVLMRRWRPAVVMAITGATLVLATIPILGIQVWFDWLHVGGEAAKTYATDRNWIFLSRDLFGIPRRMLQDYPDGQTGIDRPIAGVVGWILWFIVAGVTVLAVRVWVKRHGSPVPLRGPAGGLVLLAAWLCTYRFMYYDALIAALGVVAILADPKPYFRRGWWPFRSWAPVLAAVLLIVENMTAPLNVEVTAGLHGLRWTVTHPDGSTQLRMPMIYLATGDYYPWDTVTVVGLWVWCIVQILRGRAGGVGDRT